MKIGVLKSHYYDEGCGSSTDELATTKNIKQLEDIAVKLNKKHGCSYRNFTVTVIDTKEVKESLSRKEISNLWR